MAKSMTPVLSILIPARNEMFLQKTIEDIIEHSGESTEIIAVLDGSWPITPIDDHPRVRLIYNHVSIGQRAATNQAARASTAKYIMKVDAHCAFASGFDAAMIAAMQPDWTAVPLMYNLHAFDWVCDSCGKRKYQGPTPIKCEQCNGALHHRDIIWKPRLNRKSDSWRFDKELHFQYWGAYGKRPEAKGDISDTMSCLGACWMMERERYWKLGGLDEAHGSWGQMGTEVACKAWLSGGRLACIKTTWFAHMFRTQGGDFGFPYPQSAKQVEHARQYSRDIWLNDKWPHATRKFQWIIDHFAPIPDWHSNTSATISTSSQPFCASIIYYTDNNPEPLILKACRETLRTAASQKGFSIISVSQKPINNFGENIVLDIGRSVLSMYIQILTGLQAAKTEWVFFAEHDLLYHTTHFDFIPPSSDPSVFYYDRNRWAVDRDTGKAVFYHTNVPSLMCGNRDFLIEHYIAKVNYVSKEGFKSSYGFSPPKGLPSQLRKGEYKCWMAEYPSIDIRHSASLTRRRMDKSQFRSERSCRGWTEAESVPGWGRTKDCFESMLLNLVKSEEA